MAKDFTNAIDALREAAVGRCRERIEQAAVRARDVIGTGNTGGNDESRPPCGKQHGVTSLLKQKHGL